MEGTRQFVYLGSIVSADDATELDIARRVQSWKCNYLNIEFRLFCANGLSILLYWSNRWKLTTTVTRDILTSDNN